MYRTDTVQIKKSKDYLVCKHTMIPWIVLNKYLKSVLVKSNKVMLAVLQDKPGDPDVLYLGQVDKPTLGDNDVLIKVWR